MLAQILYMGTMLPRGISTGDMTFLTFFSSLRIQSTTFNKLEVLQWIYEIYSENLDDKTVDNITWVTPVAAKQHHLGALIDHIKVTMVVCDKNFLCNKISPSVMIHMDIGLSLHELFFGGGPEVIWNILFQLNDVIS